MILTPATAAPRCDATVDLISRAQRPYLFRVTVTGHPPHAFTRVYKVAAVDDDSAAMCGLQQFVKEFSPKVVREMKQPTLKGTKLQ